MKFLSQQKIVRNLVGGLLAVVLVVPFVYMSNPKAAQASCVIQGFPVSNLSINVYNTRTGNTLTNNAGADVVLPGDWLQVTANTTNVVSGYTYTPPHYTITSATVTGPGGNFQYVANPHSFSLSGNGSALNGSAYYIAGTLPDTITLTAQGICAADGSIASGSTTVSLYNGSQPNFGCQPGYQSWNLYTNSGNAWDMKLIVYRSNGYNTAITSNVTWFLDPYTPPGSNQLTMTLTSTQNVGTTTEYNYHVTTSGAAPTGFYIMQMTLTSNGQTRTCGNFIHLDGPGFYFTISPAADGNANVQQSSPNRIGIGQFRDFVITPVCSGTFYGPVKHIQAYTDLAGVTMSFLTLTDQGQNGKVLNCNASTTVRATASNSIPTNQLSSPSALPILFKDINISGTGSFGS